MRNNHESEITLVTYVIRHVQCTWYNYWYMYNKTYVTNIVIVIIVISVIRITCRVTESTYGLFQAPPI